MNVYVFFTATLVIIPCVIFENECTPIDKEKDMDKPVFLCGSKIPIALQSICKGKLVDHSDNGNSGGGKKSKVVDECCIIPCTLRHLFDNYCDHDDNKNNSTTSAPITSTPKIETTTIDKKSWWLYPIGAGPWAIE